MKFFIRAFILLASVYASSANSAWMTGNELLQLINGSTDDQAQAFSFVRGVVDLAESRNITVGTSDETNVECINIPGTVTLGQLKSIVEKHLKDHPEDLHLSAGYLVWVATRLAFGPGTRCI